MPLSRFAVISGLALGLLFSGCGSVDVELGDSIPLESLRADHLPPLWNTGFDEMHRIVVRDEVIWEGTWIRLWSNYSEMPPLPAVDFDDHVVILATMGSRPTTGYSIEIEGAYRDRDQVVVRVVSTSPGRGCVVGYADTTPADIARMPATDLRIRFEERRVVRNCS